jgi:hypothetical protein
MLVLNFTYVDTVHLYSPDATGSCRIRAISPMYLVAFEIMVGLHSLIKTRVASIPFYRALLLSLVSISAVHVASVTLLHIAL